MQPFRSATIPVGRLLPGIHGLRGIAALAVVLFHLVHLADIAPPPAFSFIASEFGKGVHLFFVISAFSLMHSTEHTLHRPSWAAEYFVKRFFRIAPLFYCVLGAMVLWPAINAGRLTVGLDVLLLNLTFTFGFAPWSGLVWAGWTVGVEMIFYALLPVLLLTIRSTGPTLLFVVVSIVVSYAARLVLEGHFDHTVATYRYNWAYFSFLPNLCFFALGMYAFRVANSIGNADVAIRSGTAALATLLLLGLLLASKPTGWYPDLILWGFGFALLAVWQGRWPSRWCANRVFEYLGERSYSIYLLHPPLIVLAKSPLQHLHAMLTPHAGDHAYFFCAAALIGALLVVSEVSYRLVEVVGIRYGQRLAARLRQRMQDAPAGVQSFPDTAGRENRNESATT